VGYWEVPADAPTAETGQWMPGPGLPFFQQMADALGSLPLMAEDLGEITPDVIALRDTLELPGMKILQFAFGSGPQNQFLPHTYPENCAVYTGTHDNDTTLGWYLSAPEWERDFCRRYLGRDGSDLVWDLIRLGWSSTANFALAPMQDLLGLDSRGRMNFPGRPSGNWSWRIPADYAHPTLAKRVHELNALYDRLPRRPTGSVTEIESSA
jgi:4-alpha-glucanotransferase